MNQYTQYITEELTRKLVKKGAPITVTDYQVPSMRALSYVEDGKCYIFPTIEQVVEWFREYHEINIILQYSQTQRCYWCNILWVESDFDPEYMDEECQSTELYNTPREAYLEGINKAIELI